MDLIEEFINSYAEYLNWSERGFDLVARKLCENYHYTPENGRELILICLGWTWAKSREKPYITANSLSVLFKIKLDKIYEIVAKENDWS